jgi:hypothetical protein
MPGKIAAVTEAAPHPRVALLLYCCSPGAGARAAGESAKTQFSQAPAAAGALGDRLVAVQRFKGAGDHRIARAGCVNVVEEEVTYPGVVAGVGIGNSCAAKGVKDIGD